MKARTPGVNALLTLVWWALLAAVSFLSALLMYSFGEENGPDSSSFLPVTVVRPNLICYVLGLLCWLAACVLIWKRLLRPCFDLCRGQNPGWMFLWLLEAALGLTAQFMTALFGMLTGMDALFARTEPEILDYFFFVAAIFPALFGAADLLIGHFRKKRSES